MSYIDNYIVLLLFRHRKVLIMSLSEIREKDEKLWRQIRNEVYESAKDENGYYVCAESGYRSKNEFQFHIDHIILDLIKEKQNLKILDWLEKI